MEVLEMKRNIKIFLIITLCLLALTGCGETNYIDATYYDVYNNSNYIILSKDGNLTNSLWTEYTNGIEKISDSYKYKIENGYLVAINQTKYEGDNTLKENTIGLMYKDFICNRWNGDIYPTYSDTNIYLKIDQNIKMEYILKNDKSYEYTITQNETIQCHEIGYYEINNDIITLTNDNNDISAVFINIKNIPYCIQYRKK